MIYKGWKAFDVYRENLVKYRKISQNRDLKWQEKRLTKSYKYIRNDYGLATVLRLFLKRKL